MGGRKSLASLGFADSRLNNLLVGAVAGIQRANVIVAATMSGGKATLLQALLAHTPPFERVDTIEDTPELRLTRDANADGVDKLTMTDHIRDAKRGNAGKIVVGEVRGEGTLALFDAMSRQSQRAGDRQRHRDRRHRRGQGSHPNSLPVATGRRGTVGATGRLPQEPDRGRPV